MLFYTILSMFYRVVNLDLKYSKPLALPIIWLFPLAKLNLEYLYTNPLPLVLWEFTY